MTPKGEWPVVVRFVVNEEDRRQVAEHYGEPGLASLRTMRRYLESCAYAELAEAGRNPLSMYDEDEE